MSMDRFLSFNAFLHFFVESYKTFTVEVFAFLTRLVMSILLLLLFISLFEDFMNIIFPRFYSQ